MANALFDKGREAFLKGEVDWLNDTVRGVLVDSATYTVDLANDDFLSVIPSGARVAVSPALTNKSTGAGVADADDITFSSVSGAQSEAVVLYQDTGTEATSPLLAYIDTATGLPVTPDGTDITVQWDDGVNKIFKL